MSTASEFKTTALTLAVLVLGVVAVYQHTLDYAFVFDDAQNIRDNENLKMTELSLESVRRVVFEAKLKERPVANLSFALNHYFSGPTTRGYRLTNIIVHLVNGTLLFVLARLILRRLEPDETAGRWHVMLAAITAVLWTLHPVQTQSVTYIVQRMNSLATCFYLLATVAYFIGRTHPPRRTLCYGIAFVSWFAAMGSKEYAVTLPFAILLLEFYLFRALDRNWAIRNLKYVAIPAIIVVAVGLLYVGNPMSLLRGFEFREFTLWERVITQGRVLVFYIGLFFLPLTSRMTLDQHFHHSTSLLQPWSTSIAILLLVALALGAWRLAPRHRLLSLGIAWFFLHLAVESTVIPLEMAYDHRLYLPSTVVMLTIVWYIHRSFIHHAGARGLLLTIIGLCFMHQTYARNLIWKTEYSVWQDSVIKSPNKARSNTNFGYQLRHRGELDRAIQHYRKAIKLDPEFHLAYNNLGVAYIDQHRYPEAIVQLERARTLRPKHWDTHDNLGVAYAKSGRLDDALTSFLLVLDHHPGSASTYNHVGNIYFTKKKFLEAKTYYEKALGLEPGHALAHNSMAGALLNLGDTDGAIVHYKRALELNPKYENARRNLKVALAVKAKEQAQ